MAVPSLEDCLARIDWADVHLNTLDELLNRYIQSDAHSIVAHVDPKTAGPIPMDGSPSRTEIVLFGHARGEPPSREASLIIADIVNNLRAALDNVAWALSVDQSGPPPPDPLPRGRQSDSEWRGVNFPIVTDRNDWPSRRGSSLRLVDPRIWTVFEQAQPFVRRQHDPERDELAVLDELWNIDKHRHLVLTEFWVGLDDVVSKMERDYQGIPLAGPNGELNEFPPGHFDGHTFLIVSKRSPGPFVDGAELGRVVENGSIFTIRPEMHVDPKLTRDVAFEKGSPAYEGRVVETLTNIRDAVRPVVETFRPYL